MSENSTSRPLAEELEQLETLMRRELKRQIAALAGDDLDWAYNAVYAARQIELWGKCLSGVQADRMKLLPGYRPQDGSAVQAADEQEVDGLGGDPAVGTAGDSK